MKIQVKAASRLAATKCQVTAAPNVGSTISGHERDSLSDIADSLQKSTKEMAKIWKSTKNAKLKTIVHKAFDDIERIRVNLEDITEEYDDANEDEEG